MKKDSPRRKIVDAIDFLTEEVVGQQIAEVAIEDIEEFSEHPFHLYEGKRLEDMVESIKTNGVLNPVIVRKLNDGSMEMLSGHNRMNASRLAGLKTVPAFIKENLTDEEAYIYVIETNLMQRSFNDMYPSEKAIVLQLRYEKVTNQGKRTDIIKELKALETGETDEIIDEEPAIDSRGRLAKEYGLSGRTMARLLRLNNLTEDWKRAVDNDIVALMVGVELSYLPEDIQVHLYSECEELGIKLSLKDAKHLKALQGENGLDENVVSKYLLQNEKGKLTKKDFQSFKLPTTIMNRYFEESTSKKEMQSIIEKALEQYFENRGMEV